MTETPDQSLRIDKWLWYARVLKTRSLAQKMVQGGAVRVNASRISAAHKVVRPGDVLTITLPSRVRVLKIVECGTRRGPASEAQALYEDLSPPVPKQSAPPDNPNEAAAPKPEQRPGSRERQALARLKRGG